MNKKDRAAGIISALKKEYEQVKCELTYDKPHELLIATRLSAQCTDKRVNSVTPALFGKFPSAEAFARAEVRDVEEIIKSCGLFHTKARDIVEMCREITEKYDGKVPDSIEKLLKLPGVGRKTANLIVGELYGKPAFVCDTHVIRLSNRLGLANGEDANSVEKQLRAAVPAKEGLGLCHRLVKHGRTVCSARKPDCGKCVLEELCKTAEETQKARKA